MTVATRNVADFKPTGVNIINPWETSDTAEHPIKPQDLE
jgi:hypothetical protein